VRRARSVLVCEKCALIDVWSGRAGRLLTVAGRGPQEGGRGGDSRAASPPHRNRARLVGLCRYCTPVRARPRYLLVDAGSTRPPHRSVRRSALTAACSTLERCDQHVSVHPSGRSTQEPAHHSTGQRGAEERGTWSCRESHRQTPGRTRPAVGPWHCSPTSAKHSQQSTNKAKSFQSGCAPNMGTTCATGWGPSWLNWGLRWRGTTTTASPPGAGSDQE